MANKVGWTVGCIRQWGIFFSIFVGSVGAASGAEHEVSLGFTPIVYAWENGNLEVRFRARGDVLTLAREPSRYQPILNESDETPFAVFRLADGGALVGLVDGGTIKIPEIFDSSRPLWAQALSLVDDRYQILFHDPETKIVVYILTIGPRKVSGRSVSGLRLIGSNGMSLRVDDFMISSEVSARDLVGFASDQRFSILDPLGLSSGFVQRDTVTSMLQLGSSLRVGVDFTPEDLVEELLAERELERSLSLNVRRNSEPADVIYIIDARKRQWTKNPEACEWLMKREETSEH